MEDYQAWRAVESYGQDEDAPQREEKREEGAFFTEEPPPKKYSILPILQLGCCALIFLALLFIKFTDTQRYREMTQWYQEKMEETIELPSLLERIPKGDGEEEDAPQSEAEPARAQEGKQETEGSLLPEQGASGVLPSSFLNEDQGYHI